MQALAYPPLNGSILLHEIPGFHAIHNPSHPCFVFRAEEADSIHEISHLEFSRAVHRAAHRFSYLSGKSVGVMALTDTPVYLALFLGLMKAGCVPILLSPRNSALATAKLLNSINSDVLVTTPRTLQSLVDDVQLAFKADSADDPDRPLEIEECPLVHDLFPKLGSESHQDPFTAYEAHSGPGLTDVACYLHTSGSTGFPKAISHSHLSLLQWGTTRCLVDIRDCDVPLRISATMLPSFHIYGLYLQLIASLVALRTVAVAPPLCTSPESLPFTHSPGSVIKHTKLTQSNAIATLPAILSLWESDREALSVLKQLHVVWYGGGPMSTHSGTRLHKQRINLVPIYGATEFGAIAHALPSKADIEDGDWDYMRLDSSIDVRWLPHGNGLFQPQFLAGERHQLSARNALDGSGYAPSDLFMRHPTKDLWKVADRIDNVLVMSSGEKLVPAPMEDVINTCPIVQSSIIFGAGRLYTGVVIQCKSDVYGDDESCKDQIWLFIEKANAIAPAFGRIFRNMIIIAPASKHMILTAKGTIARSATLDLFRDEIEGLYEDTLSNDRVLPPASWTPNNILTYLSDVASRLQGNKVEVDKDLFEQGFDSLHARLLWQHVITAMKSSDIRVQNASEGFKSEMIYAYPTLVRLAEVIHGILSEDTGSLVDHTADSSILAMKELYEKYSAGLVGKRMPSESPDLTSRNNPVEVVLLTGSTGSLGAHILTKLVADPRVKKVYCLNRPSSSSTQSERHCKILEKQRLDVDLIKNPKVVLLNGNGKIPHFGLNTAVYDKLRSSVDSIIHCAWSVNFVHNITSFESNLKVTRGLIDFALESQHSVHTRFLFASSISSVQSWDNSRGLVPESPIQDWAVAAGGGYGASKYVAERMLLHSGLQVSVLRYGQLSGGRQSGTWPITEWFPILVKSSIAIGAFPNLTGAVAWLPTDSAAQCTVDIAMNLADTADAESGTVLNISHPQRVLWMDVITWLQTALIEAGIVKSVDDVAFVTGSEWISRLEGWTGGSSNPFNSKLIRESIAALELMDFFRNFCLKDSLIEAGNDAEIGGMPTFSTMYLQEISSTIQDIVEIGPEEIRKWVDHWKAVGFLTG